MVFAGLSIRKHMSQNRFAVTFVLVFRTILQISADNTLFAYYTSFTDINIHLFAEWDPEWTCSVVGYLTLSTGDENFNNFIVSVSITAL